jgi:glycosyltransferase involved in cell wall biosynthesis
MYFLEVFAKRIYIQIQPLYRAIRIELRLGFALEYSLGHATHAQNLKRVLESDSLVAPTYIDLPFHNTPGVFSCLPGVRSNWSIRASLGAYAALRPIAGDLQACLFHSQVTSLFSTGLMRRMPSVVSLDATPLQYDRLGSFYGHAASSNARIERLKRYLNIRAFSAAATLVTWSRWAKESLVRDYGVLSDKICVIPPGIDMDRWVLPLPVRLPHEPVNLLFVGGDFERKGGSVLLDAMNQVTASHNIHLHIVTKAAVDTDTHPNVTLYNNISPNSEELLRLFCLADIFVFPTFADCLPLAIMEAMAAGRPIITTSVGALPEAVVHGESGLIVPPGDAPALALAISTLAKDPTLRTQLGHKAREVALERFDAKTNYTRLVDVVKSVVR